MGSLGAVKPSNSRSLWPVTNFFPQHTTQEVKKNKILQLYVLHNQSSLCGMTYGAGCIFLEDSLWVGQLSPRPLLEVNTYNKALLLGQKTFIDVSLVALEGLLALLLMLLSMVWVACHYHSPVSSWQGLPQQHLLLHLYLSTKEEQSLPSIVPAPLISHSQHSSTAWHSPSPSVISFCAGWISLAHSADICQEYFLSIFCTKILIWAIPVMIIKKSNPYIMLFGLSTSGGYRL